ncbi:hypothetical protein J6590_049568 [Homalodisca vitripennis]|nr:hypothetical protein J6590_049568 [Homalodisca vitripennis]
MSEEVVSTCQSRFTTSNSIEPANTTQLIPWSLHSSGRKRKSLTKTETNRRTCSVSCAGPLHHYRPLKLSLSPQANTSGKSGPKTIDPSVLIDILQAA